MPQHEPERQKGRRWWPRVASAEKQAEFIALYERMMNALDADEAVYFADAVHPEYQTKPAFGWVKAGTNPAVKSTAGRGRVNIHGALNLETFDAPFVEPTTVDGVSAAQLLVKIEANNPDKRVIHVIWDNAAYHRGPDVRDFLARPECRIHLIQLPPYCPHLNPIERLWAVMHQCVTYNRYYPIDVDVDEMLQCDEPMAKLAIDTVPEQIVGNEDDDDTHQEQPDGSAGYFEREKDKDRRKDELAGAQIIQQADPHGGLGNFDNEVGCAQTCKDRQHPVYGRRP